MPKSYIGNKYGKVKAVINDLLMNVKNLQPVFIGVNLTPIIAWLDM